MAIKQKRSLAFKPPLMLINDSDIQGECISGLESYGVWREDGGVFDNPVRDTVLRWRG